MNSVNLSLVLLFIVSLCMGQSGKADLKVKDIDGNVYSTVKIGEQVWTVENLRTTRYNDGTRIRHITDNVAWIDDTAGAYCYYNNSSKPDGIGNFGAIYTWAAVNKKKLAPTGWHVATDSDWETLENYLITNKYNVNGDTTDPSIAKALAAKTGWEEYEKAGEYGAKVGVIGDDPTQNDKSGFTALPGGYRDQRGNFDGIGTGGYWWSIPDDLTGTAKHYYLLYDDAQLLQEMNTSGEGYSVRLVKD